MAKKKRPPGRHPPRKPLTPEQIGQIEALAGYGLTQPQIAAVLDFSGRTLARHKTEEPQVVAALERGRAVAQGNVGKALYTRATGGDVAAIRWYEMTRAGRTEKQRIDLTNLSEQERLDRLVAILTAAQLRLED